MLSIRNDSKRGCRIGQYINMTFINGSVKSSLSCNRCPGVGVTKAPFANFPVTGNLDLANVYVRYF